MAEHSQVIVYLLTGDPDSDRVHLLKSKFNDYLFNLQIVDIPVVKASESDYNYKRRAEKYRIEWCLRDARENYFDSHILIVKDTSISHVESSHLSDVITTACNSNNSDPKESWHLLYLCTWGDRCDLYDDKSGPSVNSTNIVRTYSPHGLQAVVYSPYARDVLLGHKLMLNEEQFKCPDDHSLDAALSHHIENENLHAYTTKINLFDYDPTLAENTGDFSKLSHCTIYPKPLKKEKKQKKEERLSGAFLGCVIVVVVIIILLLIALQRYRR